MLQDVDGQTPLHYGTCKVLVIVIVCFLDFLVFNRLPSCYLKQALWLNVNHLLFIIVAHLLSLWTLVCELWSLQCLLPLRLL